MINYGANRCWKPYCWAMTELLTTNDAVLISYASALLDGEGIPYAIFDSNMSIVEGSIGVLPRRLMVDPEWLSQAQRLMDEAGVTPC